MEVLLIIITTNLQQFDKKYVLVFYDPQMCQREAPPPSPKTKTPNVIHGRSLMETSAGARPVVSYTGARGCLVQRH